MKEKNRKFDIALIIGLIGTVLIFLSHGFNYFKLSLVFNIFFSVGFTLISIASAMYTFRFYKQISNFYHKILKGKNKLIIFLCKNKQFSIITFLFFLNNLIMLSILILALFLLKGCYDIVIKLPQFFISNWFTAIILFILASFSLFLAILFILASLRFQIKREILLVYLEEKLKNTKKENDFNDFLYEYSSRLFYLYKDYEDDIEKYNSLRFVKCYINSFFYLPSLKLKTKKELIIRYISKSIKGTYVDMIITLKKVDRIIKSKCKIEYLSLRGYFMNIYDFKDKDLFSMLRSISLTKFDKIKNFILTHNEILVLLLKLLYLVIFIILALVFKFSNFGNTLIKIVEAFQ